MSDFLLNLVTRSLGAAPLIQPRLPSLFEPAKPYIGSFGEASDEGEDNGREAKSAVESANGQHAAQQERQAPASRSQTEERGSSESPPPIPQASRAERPKREPAVRTLGAPPVQAMNEGPRESKPSERQPAVRTPAQRTSARLSPPLAETTNDDRTSARASVVPAFEKSVPADALTPSESLPQAAASVSRQSAPQHPSKRSEAAVRTALDSIPAKPDAPRFSQLTESHTKPSVVAPSSMRGDHVAVRTPAAMDPTSAPRFDFARHLPPAPHGNPPEPTIQVTIGRIEVRAVPSQAPSSKQQGPASPVMNLSDYLHSRRGGA
jgi:hypothetical protein